MAERYPYREPEAASGFASRQLPEQLAGYTLDSSDNKHVGKIVEEAGPNNFHVTTGLLGLGSPLYVPRSAIDHCSGDTCYLNVSSDQIHTMAWNQPPPEQQMPGYRTEEAPAAAERPAEGFPTQPAGKRFEQGVTQEETRRIPLRDEEIAVHKHREKVGEVVIGKEVVEEQRTIDVPVNREEITIETHTVDRPSEGQIPPVGRESEVVRVPIYEDVVDVEKRAHVHEEVVVSPEEVTTQERVTRTVRREVPEVSTTGEAGKFVHESGELGEKPENPPTKSREQRRESR